MLDTLLNNPIVQDIIILAKPALFNLYYALASIPFGFPLAIILALGKYSKTKLFSWPSRIFIYAFRGSPLFIQFFMFYSIMLSLNKVLWRPMGVDEVVLHPLFIGPLVLVLNTAAYAAEIFYGALKTIPKGEVEAAKAMGIEKDSVTILIHCGSRGFGHQICSDYLRISEQVQKKYNIQLPDRELACVPNKSEEGESYRAAMFAALNFAWSNRQMITHWTRKSFERIFKQSESDLDMRLVYDVAHNIAKVEKHKIDGKLKSVVVHRKGATRAFPANMDDVPAKYRALGQPVLVPGSMGTGSWILLGQENSMNMTFGSTAHGAGRMMSRSKARRNFTESEVKKSLSDKGIFLKSLTRDGVVEETPQAYKDVDAVVNVSHELGIATKVAKLVPMGVIKG